MSDLVTWLRQELDADEQLAVDVHTAGCAAAQISYRISGACECGMPAWVVAEVAAKRAILDAYTEAAEFYDAPANRHHPAGEVHGLWTALRWLALPYASNPGYDESWRPA